MDGLRLLKSWNVMIFFCSTKNDKKKWEQASQLLDSFYEENVD